MERAGRYHVVERIGTADHTETYRAYEVTGGGLVRPLVLERIGSVQDAVAADVLVVGAQIAGRLDHPNIVRVLDLDQDERGPYAVKAALFGRPLATLLERARSSGVAVDPMAAMYIGVQLLGALAHAHQHAGADGSMLGIVHRDVQPGSITIGFAGEVHLDGFGYAQTRQRADPPVPGGATPRFGYQSPEQASGGGVDHRADIFSIGLILWEILAGQPPRPSDPGDARDHAMRGIVTPLGEIAPNVSGALASTIDRALVSDPNQRHPSAAVFRDELARLLFSAEPTYSGARLASLVTMVLGAEAADDRRRDAEARRQFGDVPPAGMRAATMATPSKVPVSQAPVSQAPVSQAPASVAQVPVAAPLYGAPPASNTPGFVEPAPPGPMPDALARAETSTVLPPLDDEGGLPLGRILLGVIGIVLVAGLVFTFSSSRNSRLVGRKLRAAVVGRKAGGTLTIESIPPGALVRVNDEDTGKRTPLTIENLESEYIHDIELSIEGEKTKTATVTINAGQKRTVNLVFEGAVVNMGVKTVPDGCALHLDGRNVALTPTSLSVRTGREVKIKLEKLGYVPFEKTVTPQSGQPIDLDVTLEKTPELLAQEAEEAAAMKALEEESKPKKRRRRRRR